MQHDHMLEYLTVEETLTAAAHLKMKTSSRIERLARVEEVMKELGSLNYAYGSHSWNGLRISFCERFCRYSELSEYPDRRTREEGYQWRREKTRVDSN